MRSDPNNSGRVLVTGANGFIGSFLVERLLQEGRPVRCLIRPSSLLHFLPREKVELAYGSMTDADSLARAVNGCDRIIHLASYLRGSRPEHFHTVNVKGTQLLLEAAWRHAPDLQRFVFVSSLAAHGPSTRQVPAVEGLMDRPVSYYGQSKLQAEEGVQAFSHRLPVTIVRPPPVYGPRERDLLKMFRLIRKGIRPVYHPDKYFSLIYIQDLIAGMMQAVHRREACGRIYYLADPSPCSWNAFMAEIADTVNPRAIGVPLRPWMLKTAAFLGDWYNRFTRREVIINRQKLRELLPDCWTCDPAKAQKELGFRSQVSLTEGIRQTADWYKRQGWL